MDGRCGGGALGKTKLPVTRSNDGSNIVHSVQDFEGLIRRERERADRSGSEFSLVVYPLQHLPRDTAARQALVAALRRGAGPAASRRSKTRSPWGRSCAPPSLGIRCRDRFRRPV